MPALLRTEYEGTIIWLGTVPDRRMALQSQPVPRLTVGFGGPEGEDHAGLTRLSCSRVLSQYSRGTIIRNTRQLSVVSHEELERIADAMGLVSLDPALIGATMVIDGIPDLTHLPPSSRLQGANGATIVVDMENRSCQLPAKPIEALHRGFGAKFKSAAQGRRGVTAWVEREGHFSVGEAIRLHVPDQPKWNPKKT